MTAQRSHRQLAVLILALACGRVGYERVEATDGASAPEGGLRDVVVHEARESDSGSDQGLPEPNPVCQGLGGRDVLLGASHAHTLLVRVNGRLWVWGANGAGQLGVGDTNPRAAPLELMGSWLDVAAGRFHSCAVDRADGLSCWGGNERGRLGLGDQADRPGPTRVQPEVRWREVEAGGGHTCAIRFDGTLWCWGDNARGALGTNEPDGVFRVTATQVGAETTWSAITSGGGGSSCGLRGGALFCWGRNGSGEIGVGDEIDRRAPAAVAVGIEWQSADAGVSHVCAIRRGGTLWCWGSNDRGRAGLGDRAGANLPSQIGTGSSWTRVSAGVEHTCAIKADGTLWCWGSNDGGRLGEISEPSAAFITMPQQVGAERGWEEVVAAEHTCAVNKNRLYCWGANGSMQLGGSGSGGAEPQPVCLLQQ